MLTTSKITASQSDSARHFNLEQIAITSKAKISKSKQFTNHNTQTKQENLSNSDSIVDLITDSMADSMTDSMADSMADTDYVNSLDKFVNKKKVVKVKYIKKITETKTTKQINHEIVTYNLKQYVVCCIPFKNQYKLFTIDLDNSEKIINRTWHYRSDGSYISSPEYVEKIKKELYLHNLVMDKLTFEGRGQQCTIDHINRVGTDNRVENLRNLSSQSAQNFNQGKRERKFELPENSNINIEDIPKNIYYAKSIGAHGEYFYIELKGIPALCPDGKKYTWKSTKSKSVNLQTKLQQTINKLFELKNTYAELANVVFTYELDEQRKKSINEYNDILKLSHYPKNVIDENLRDSNGNYINEPINDEQINDEQINDEAINDEQINDEQINDEPLIDEQIKPNKPNKPNKPIKKQLDLDKITAMKNAGKKCDNLPDDCGITIDQIPKYCYFRPESDKRGCKFVIDRHPKLVEQGIRQWATGESKKISILDKFKTLTDKLDELNNA